MFPKIVVVFPPKMDGENNGSKPYEQMDDLGAFPYFWKHPYVKVKGEKHVCLMLLFCLFFNKGARFLKLLLALFMGCLIFC